MKIFITGGTGFVGTSLTQRLLERGHDVTVTSSSGKTTLAENNSLCLLTVDTTQSGVWQKQLPEYDVIINLAGRSVFHLWSKSYKKKIYNSRILTTRNIVDALPNKTDTTDTVLLSCSAAGFYGNSGENLVDEGAPVGGDFLANVCKSWEDEALKAKEKGVRVAVMRFGVVLGKQGGAVSMMKLPFMLGLGGPIGNGRQWFPWIHLNDLVEAILFLIDGSDLHGPFNFTAPDMVRQKEFARAFARTLNRPAILPTPGFIMKSVLGEFGESLLQGQKVTPKALSERGFVFSFPGLEGALKGILCG